MHSRIAVALLLLGLPVAALAQNGNSKSAPPVRTNFDSCTNQQVISCRANVTAAKQARGPAPMQRGEAVRILRTCLAKLGCTHD
jgi:hypothetical protein